jgi:hypothetical protein
MFFLLVLPNADLNFVAIAVLKLSGHAHGQSLTEDKTLSLYQKYIIRHSGNHEIFLFDVIWR